MTDLDRLTERQRETLRAVCLHDRADINDVLFVQRRSVKEMLRRVYRTLGITEGGPGKAARACYQLGQADAKEGSNGR